MLKKIQILLCVITLLMYPAIVISQDIQGQVNNQVNLTEEEQADEEKATEEENDTEEESYYEEEPSESYEEMIVIPDSGVKRTADRGLKGTGLIFMPYAEGGAFPAAQQDEEYSITETVTILPEENNSSSEQEGGENNE